MIITIWMPAVLITLALVFYSIGIWSERIIRYLKKWHVVFFWLGFIFDTLGTYAMHMLASNPFDITEPHTFTGQIALWLMLVHSVWASYIVLRGNELARNTFHKYSIVVWIVWLIPYISGMYLGMFK